jgi:hypothetical protein
MNPQVLVCVCVHVFSYINGMILLLPVIMYLLPLFMLLCKLLLMAIMFEMCVPCTLLLQFPCYFM